MIKNEFPQILRQSQIFPIYPVRTAEDRKGKEMDLKMGRGIRAYRVEDKRSTSRYLPFGRDKRSKFGYFRLDERFLDSKVYDGNFQFFQKEAS